MSTDTQPGSDATLSAEEVAELQARVDDLESELSDVRTAVDQQCTTLGYETLGEYFSLEAKCRVIEAELPADEREQHDGYQEAKARARGLERRARRLLDDAADLFDGLGANAERQPEALA